MNILCYWFSAILPLALAQNQFGTSYLKNSRLCTQWSCLNDHLGLQESLPPKEQYTRILQGLLPEGPWQDTVGPVLDICYGDRPRTYSNSCPGQALLQCVVEQLIQNCPAENWVKKDACAPITSLAGVKYMFSQSRYNDLDINLPTDRRPAWFLKNYFNSKCCDLPPLFNETVLKQCGFNSIVHYYRQQTRTHAPENTFKVDKNHTKEGVKLQVVSFDDLPPVTPNIREYGEYDPLDCCDMHEFISPTWRSDCGFEMRWNSETRLRILNSSTAPTTTEAPRSLRTKDVKMVPNSCDQSNCVFKALNIVSDSGAVDKDAFSKLLNNLTDMHPAWVKAKGRVITTCLRRPLTEYEYDCEINKLLACTFDVLSENCPNSISPDTCRHSGLTKNEVICQISSSKYRPKNRRLFCGIPNLVNHVVLSQCSINSLIKLEYVPETVFKAKSLSDASPMCEDSTPSTICLMDKMGVLNKYGFMDYFRMKDRIRWFSYGEWYPYSNAFVAALQNMLLYRDQCTSPRKLLNVIDTMLMTCPYSKRRINPQCDTLFSDLTNKFPKNGTQNEMLLKHFGHLFLTNQHLDLNINRPYSIANPIFDFGLFSWDAPPVKTIDLRPTEKTLVLLPVYQRTPSTLSNKELIWRNNPITPNAV